MGDGKKGADSPKYPALSALRRRKKCRDYVDYDYVQKLSPAEKAFLNQFTDEYYNGNSYKFGEPLLDTKEMARKNYLARSDLMNEYHRVEASDAGGAPHAGEEAIVEALDEDRPDIGIKRAFPVPASPEPSGTTGPGGSSHRPAMERPTRVADGLALKTSIPINRLEQRMSKTGHAKKRAKAKVAKLAVAAPPRGSMGGDMFRQVANLLKGAMHLGANAGSVAQAIDLMEQSATVADAHPAPKPEAEAANGKENA